MNLKLYNNLWGTISFGILSFASYLITKYILINILPDHDMPGFGPYIYISGVTWLVSILIIGEYKLEGTSIFITSQTLLFLVFLAITDDVLNLVMYSLAQNILLGFICLWLLSSAVFIFTLYLLVRNTLFYLFSINYKRRIGKFLSQLLTYFEDPENKKV